MKAPVSAVVFAAGSMLLSTEAVNLQGSAKDIDESFADKALKDSIPDMLTTGTDFLKELAEKLD